MVCKKQSIRTSPEQGETISLCQWHGIHSSVKIVLQDVSKSSSAVDIGPRDGATILSDRSVIVSNVSGRRRRTSRAAAVVSAAGVMKPREVGRIFGANAVRTRSHLQIRVHPGRRRAHSPGDCAARGSGVRRISRVRRQSVAAGTRWPVARIASATNRKSGGALVADASCSSGRSTRYVTGRGGGGGTGSCPCRRIELGQSVGRGRRGAGQQTTSGTGCNAHEAHHLSLVRL
jgi:hypothetical protein